LIKKFALALLTLVLISPAHVYAVPGVLIVDLEGKSINVSYDAEGVEIISVTPDLDFISLILEVEVTGSPGILEITFDRSFFDSTFQGSDDVFIIIADGDEPDSEEIGTTTQSRTLRIELPAGTEEVEIIGTEFAMPETTVPPPPPPEEPPVMEEPPAMEEPETPSGPKTQCGTGTVLKDGVCVLEEKCGSGTVLQDGMCVASPSAKKIDVSISRDLITGGGTALVIAFIMIIFFAIISRASR
jgi:hypothetical protein